MNKNINYRDVLLVVLGGLTAYATMFVIRNKSNIARIVHKD